MGYAEKMPVSSEVIKQWGSLRLIILFCSVATLLLTTFFLFSCSKNPTAANSNGIDPSNIPKDYDLIDDTAGYSGPTGTMLAATALSSPVLAALAGGHGQSGRSSLNGMSVGMLQKAVQAAYAVGIDLSTMSPDSAANDPLIQAALRVGTPIVFENTAALASYQAGLLGILGGQSLSADTAAARAAAAVMAAAIGTGVQSQIAIAVPSNSTLSTVSQIFCLGAGSGQPALAAGTQDSASDTATPKLDTVGRSNSMPPLDTIAPKTLQSSISALPTIDPATLMTMVQSAISQGLQKRTALRKSAAVQATQTGMPALVTKKDFIIKYPAFDWYPNNAGQLFVMQCAVHIQIFFGHGGTTKWVRIIADDTAGGTTSSGFLNSGALKWMNYDDKGYFMSGAEVKITNPDSWVKSVGLNPVYVDGGQSKGQAEIELADYNPPLATSETSFGVDYVDNGVKKTWTSDEIRQFKMDEFELTTSPVYVDFAWRLMVFTDPYGYSTMRMDNGSGVYSWENMLDDAGWGYLRNLTVGTPLTLSRGTNQTGLHPMVQACYSVDSSEKRSTTFIFDTWQQALELWSKAPYNKNQGVYSATILQNITVDFGKFSASAPLWATGTQGNPGAYRSFQADGNLIIHAPNGAILWASNTGGHSGTCTIKMQDDGNLVIYDASGNAIWASNTYGNPGAKDMMQSDGNYVIYSKP